MCNCATLTNSWLAEDDGYSQAMHMGWTLCGNVGGHGFGWARLFRCTSCNRYWEILRVGRGWQWHRTQEGEAAWFEQWMSQYNEITSDHRLQQRVNAEAASLERAGYKVEYAGVRDDFGRLVAWLYDLRYEKKGLFAGHLKMKHFFLDYKGDVCIEES